MQTMQSLFTNHGIFVVSKKKYNNNNSNNTYMYTKIRMPRKIRISQ